MQRRPTCRPRCSSWSWRGASTVSPATASACARVERRRERWEHICGPAGEPARPAAPAELRGPWMSSSSSCRPRRRPSTSIWATATRSCRATAMSATCRRRTARSCPTRTSRSSTRRWTEKKKRVDEIARAVKDGAKRLILATDPDREGEAISWHLLELLQPEEGAEGRRRRARRLPRGHQARRARGHAPRPQPRRASDRRLPGPPRAGLSRGLPALAGAVAQAAQVGLARPAACSRWRCA